VSTERERSDSVSGPIAWTKPSDASVNMSSAGGAESVSTASSAHPQQASTGHSSESVTLWPSPSLAVVGQNASADPNGNAASDVTAPHQQQRDNGHMQID